MTDNQSQDVQNTLQIFLKQFGSDDQITRIIVEEILLELLKNTKNFK
jgi:hypothetical protein